MTKKTNIGEKQRVIYSAGPWYVQVNKATRKCHATSGDVWFPVSRMEAVKLLLRKAG